MMRTYWKAESYKSGELHSIDFPERKTRAEATCDAEEYLSELGEFDARHITAAVVEWLEENGDVTNTGNFADVKI
jgi:predicted ATPase